ncbi:MAG: protein serine/threonine phosphatase, sigma-B regulation protein RsbU (phosphoserine phosphatase) [Candidatus Peregrinibacteria bacterium GW2011_GWF2_38_29]|nr:MAG: protein serine/threonine phosphatase, sigma-B regulation protein RsbU (phosphoserine phosphatase) [Candidatus Peregrinibacteria bacterium GW2011_GWF2_38_29]HBB02962.1 hypothetical protein [Candidatus Peregrinibacteria bacterium]
MFNTTTKRLVFYVFIFLAILGGAFYTDMIYFKYLESVPTSYVVVGILTLVFLYTWLVVYLSVAKPISIVIKQLSYLLTGKPYKKIITTRKDEVGILAYFFNEIATTLEKLTVQAKENKRMSDELSLASKLQKDIMPKKAPVISGLSISAKASLASEVGGDNFDFLVYPKNAFVYLGDVTGHGVPAALVMTMTHAFLESYTASMEDPCKILINLNEQLRKRISSRMFMTLVMLRWDLEKKKMTYTGAGHEHIIIYHADAGQCEAIKTGGIAIGMAPDNSKLLKEIELPLKENDFVVLYSDGITEAKNMNGEMFSLDRLTKAVEKYAHQYSADGLSYHIALDLKAFTGEDAIQADDMSLIAVQYVGDKKVEQTEESLATEWKK